MSVPEPEEIGGHWEYNVNKVKNAIQNDFGMVKTHLKTPTLWLQWPDSFWCRPILQASIGFLIAWGWA